MVSRKSYIPLSSTATPFKCIYSYLENVRLKAGNYYILPTEDRLFLLINTP